MNAEHIHAVSNMQQYIEKHLQDAITLNDLAVVSHYSPYHCAKIFKEVTGLPPFDYIRQRRLTRAAQQLRDGQPRIVEVAFDFVFGSHEGFTKAFSRNFGVTPKDYRTAPRPLKWFLPHDIMDYHTYLNHKGDIPMNHESLVIFAQLIKRPTRKFLLKRGQQATHYFDYCEEVGCEVWGTLVSVKEALFEPVGAWLPAALIKSGTSQYVQGVELPFDYDGGVPEGFEMIELSACDYLVFQGPAYDDAFFEVNIQAMRKALKQYNPSLFGYCIDLTAGPLFQLEPQGYRGYIEMHPVTQKLE